MRAVGAINDLPVTGRGSVNGGFNVEGKPPFNPGDAPVAEFRQVTPGYFESIGISVIRGRTLNDADLSKKPETCLSTKRSPNPLSATRIQ